MSENRFEEKLFEMRLNDIYHKYPWLAEQLSAEKFVSSFPVEYKRGRALTPDKPIGFDLDRDIFLEVLIAFRQSFS